MKRSMPALATSFLAAFILAASDTAALNASQLYFNLRSVTHPNGEIRGHLLPGSEPSTLLFTLRGTAFPAIRRGKAVVTRP